VVRSSRFIIGLSTVEAGTTNLSLKFEHQSFSDVAQYPSRENKPNAPLQNPKNSQKRVWFIFTVKCPTARNTADGLFEVSANSDDCVYNDRYSCTCVMVTAVFTPTFRQRMKKRRHTIQIHNLNRKDWTTYHVLPDVAHEIYQGVLYSLNIAQFNGTRVNAISSDVVRNVRPFLR
jgi:hypothetical protein